MNSVGRSLGLERKGVLNLTSTTDRLKKDVRRSKTHTDIPDRMLLDESRPQSHGSQTVITPEALRMQRLRFIQEQQKRIEKNNKQLEMYKRNLALKLERKKKQDDMKRRDQLRKKYQRRLAQQKKRKANKWKNSRRNRKLKQESKTDNKHTNRANHNKSSYQLDKNTENLNQSRKTSKKENTKSDMRQSFTNDNTDKINQRVAIDSSPAQISPASMEKEMSQQAKQFVNGFKTEMKATRRSIKSLKKELREIKKNQMGFKELLTKAIFGQENGNVNLNRLI